MESFLTLQPICLVARSCKASHAKICRVQVDKEGMMLIFNIIQKTLREEVLMGLKEAYQEKNEAQLKEWSAKVKEWNRTHSTGTEEEFLHYLGLK